MGFYSRAFLVFLMKESKKRRRKQPGKLMAKSRSQPVNLPGAWPLMNPLITVTFHRVVGGKNKGFLVKTMIFFLLKVLSNRDVSWLTLIF